MEKYKQLITEIDKVLKPIGFIKKDTTFYLIKDDNWGMIDFQASKESSASEKLFTINIGVSSTVLRDYSEDELKKKPSIWDAHWSMRIGSLLPDKNDYWWKINLTTNIKSLFIEIKSILVEKAIPQLLKVITDNDLIENWLNNNYTGTSEAAKYKYLLILLKKHNRVELLDFINQLKQIMKGKPYEHSIKYLINDLGIE
jgi:hypothetical protein